MARSRVTIREVAARAGVSHQTVSRVINGSKRVLPETRERIEKAIAELGYRPNAIARSMAKGTSGTLACIAPNLTDYTFASIVDGAELQARKEGYFLLSASAPDEKTFSALIDELASSRRTEGMIVMNPYQDSRHSYLSDAFPTVFAGARPRPNINYSVALDDFVVAQQATQHLIELGHRRIAMITGPMVEDCCQDRRDGYLQALTNAHISPNATWQVEGEWSAQSGYESFKALVNRGECPTAVFAQNDHIAVGVIKAARELGLSVPEQLSVIGVDDIPLASFFTPPLTTMRQDFAAIGQEAVKLLMLAIRQPDAPKQNHVLPAELILRESTALMSA